MPIYEYQCKYCSHELEKLQRISDEPLSDCPECGKPELIRLVSAAGFRLKGAGWYETDFKKGGRKNLHDEVGSKPDKPSDKTADKPVEAKKTEPKPAASKTGTD